MRLNGRGSKFEKETIFTVRSSRPSAYGNGYHLDLNVSVTPGKMPEINLPRSTVGGVP